MPALWALSARRLRSPHHRMSSNSHMHVHTRICTQTRTHACADRAVPSVTVWQLALAMQSPLCLGRGAAQARLPCRVQLGCARHTGPSSWAGRGPAWEWQLAAGPHAQPEGQGCAAGGPRGWRHHLWCRGPSCTRPVQPTHCAEARRLGAVYTNLTQQLQGSVRASPAAATPLPLPDARAAAAPATVVAVTDSSCAQA